MNKAKKTIAVVLSAACIASMSVGLAACSKDDAENANASTSSGSTTTTEPWSDDTVKTTKSTESTTNKNDNSTTDKTTKKGETTTATKNGNSTNRSNNTTTTTTKKTSTATTAKKTTTKSTTKKSTTKATTKKTTTKATTKATTVSLATAKAYVENIIYTNAKKYGLEARNSHSSGYYQAGTFYTNSDSDYYYKSPLMREWLDFEFEDSAPKAHNGLKLATFWWVDNSDGSSTLYLSIR